jgi:hypothetical protein
VLLAPKAQLTELPAQTFTVACNTFSSPDCVKNKFGV